MTLEQIELIFNTPHQKIKDGFGFRKGMTILFDLFEQSEEFCFIEGQIFYGDPNEICHKITPQQCIDLASYGWFIDEDSFSYLS